MKSLFGIIEYLAGDSVLPYKRGNESHTYLIYHDKSAITYLDSSPLLTKNTLQI